MAGKTYNYKLYNPQYISISAYTTYLLIWYQYNTDVE